MCIHTQIDAWTARSTTIYYIVPCTDLSWGPQSPHLPLRSCCLQCRGESHMLFQIMSRAMPDKQGMPCKVCVLKHGRPWLSAAWHGCNAEVTDSKCWCEVSCEKQELNAQIALAKSMWVWQDFDPQCPPVISSWMVREMLVTASAMFRPCLNDSREQLLQTASNVSHLSQGKEQGSSVPGSGQTVRCW